MAAVAALVGDPARANILCALMDGRAYAAGELAYVAHVSPQTASGHLAKLADAKLIASSPAGRHRYYRLAGPHVAAMLESIMAVASVAPPLFKPPRVADDMRAARMSSATRGGFTRGGDAAATAIMLSSMAAPCGPASRK